MVSAEGASEKFRFKFQGGGQVPLLPPPPQENHPLLQRAS